MRVIIFINSRITDLLLVNNAFQKKERENMSYVKIVLSEGVIMSPPKALLLLTVSSDEILRQ